MFHSYVVDLFLSKVVDELQTLDKVGCHGLVFEYCVCHEEVKTDVTPDDVVASLEQYPLYFQVGNNMQNHNSVVCQIFSRYGGFLFCLFSGSTSFPTFL